MKTITQSFTKYKTGNYSKPPEINIQKVGIVSRDYNRREGNGYRDFSSSFADILNSLDGKECDSVLFSLFTIVPRDGFNVMTFLRELKHIRAVFIEEFKDISEDDRKPCRYVIYYKNQAGWQEYNFRQVFATLADMAQHDMDHFVRLEMPRRILGNCCVLLCGETNGVKYSKGDKKIHDDFGLRAAIPSDVQIILNPIHDRMTRFEMKLKRKFLSENNRWVVSVWNKGKRDKNRRVRDGLDPAWTIFHNGKEVEVRKIEDCNILSQANIEMGILNNRNA